MASESPQRRSSVAGPVLEALWIVLLVLPAAASLPASSRWTAAEWALVAAPIWLAVAARLLLPGRAFFPVTLPIVFVGALCLGAPALRGVDPLELALQWRTYSLQDVTTALQPYAVALAAAGLALSALCACAWRWAPVRRPGRRVQFATAALTAGAAALVPGTAWPQAWPVRPVLVAVSASFDSHWLARRLYPEAALLNPRDPDATWNASRVPGAPPAETVVFVIGETVRNDYLAECHGPSRVRHVAPEALVACDVTSESDQTATSVPLMISREMPGHALRVSPDATFEHALAEAGFETHWYGVQQLPVAFPDAKRQEFSVHLTRDDAFLLPRLAAALARPAPLKAVVLHANNAHEPYCDRFTVASAPYAVDCPDISRRWDKARIGEMRLAYADAVDVSIGLVNAVIAELDRHAEPAFLVFSPDHGEGLMDDGREIVSHARLKATRWDTRVPAVFWANAAWRATHAAQWAMLRSDVSAPLMHADLVPTLLDAADVRYAEPRTLSADLLRAPPPARQRVVQTALGATVPWDALVDEARAAGPLRK
jgi:glucan phosphoethanolaminetransferase (alkaline phosphatase superfamily)